MANQFASTHVIEICLLIARPNYSAKGLELTFDSSAHDFRPSVLCHSAELGYFRSKPSGCCAIYARKSYIPFMKNVRRNKLCLCGSGIKYKRCCGIPVQFVMPQGVDGLERPDPLPVEPTFNEFVTEFGGQLVAEMMRKDVEGLQNADYFFPSDDVIAELKCFEKDLFNTPDDVQRIGHIIQKHRDSGAVSGYRGFRWVIGQESIPDEYRRDMLSLARRHIETAVRKANKQIQGTKEMLDIPNARGLVLLANDGNYFSTPAEAVILISQVMQEHFLESSIDGFVYFTVNTVAKVPTNDRELLYWVPSYRQEGDTLADFVDQLGASWGEFYAKKIGQEVPRFQTEDLRILKPMKLTRIPRRN